MKSFPCITRKEKKPKCTKSLVCRFMLWLFFTQSKNPVSQILLTKPLVCNIFINHNENYIISVPHPGKFIAILSTWLKYLYCPGMYYNVIWIIIKAKLYIIIPFVFLFPRRNHTR